MQQRVVGDEHPNVLLTMNGLAYLYMLQGKNAQAEDLYMRALRTQRRVLGQSIRMWPRQRRTSRRCMSRRSAQAEPLAREAMDIRRRSMRSSMPKHSEA